MASFKVRSFQRGWKVVVPMDSARNLYRFTQGNPTRDPIGIDD